MFQYLLLLYSFAGIIFWVTCALSFIQKLSWKSGHVRPPVIYVIHSSIRNGTVIQKGWYISGYSCFLPFPKFARNSICCQLCLHLFLTVPDYPSGGRRIYIYIHVSCTPCWGNAWLYRYWEKLTWALGLANGISMGLRPSRTIMFSFHCVVGGALPNRVLVFTSERTL